MQHFFYFGTLHCIIPLTHPHSKNPLPSFSLSLSQPHPVHPPPTYNGPTSNTAGPAAVVSSVTVVLQPVSTTYVWPEMGAVPFGAVGTVRVKPPSTAVALSR